MEKIITIVAALMAVAGAMACTNFVVGKNASVDGSTFITYAADSYSLYGFLRFQPAADHPVGTMRAIRDWDTGKPLGEIPEVAHTYSVVGNTNEYQVTIGETTYGGVEALWDTIGIDYGSLIYIALERSKTAREALACMVTLAETYGYASEGESFSIGDPDEVWIMDFIGCGPDSRKAVWVAARVPDDCISGHANQARIQTLPLKGVKKQRISKDGNQMEVMVSKDGQWMWHKDVITCAREKGLFQGEDKDFSFQKAYCPYDFSGLYACEARVWSFFRHFSDDMDQYLDYVTGTTFHETEGRYAGAPMPLFIRPNHKVSVQELRACMRDQYEGTPIDITQGIAAGPWHSKLRYGGLVYKLDSTDYYYPRPTATQQTGWSYVSQMRGYADEKVGGIFWFGVDDANTSLYMPMYSRMQTVPHCLKEGNGDLYTYSSTSAWWTFNIVANWTYPKYSRIYPDVQKKQQELEQLFDSEIADIDRQAAGMSDADARAFLTKYSCETATKSVKEWKELCIYLMTKYLDGVERKEEDGVFLRNAYGEPTGPNRVSYPEEYLRIIEPETLHK